MKPEYYMERTYCHWSRERYMETEAKAEEGTPLQVKELPEAFWGYLKPGTRAMLEIKQNSVIIDFDKDEDGNLWPKRNYCKGEWLPKDGRPEGHKYKRVAKCCMFFTKRVRYEADGTVPDWALRKTAATMDKLFDAGKIDYGTVGGGIELPLASGETETVPAMGDRPAKTIDMGPPSCLICIYVFSTDDSLMPHEIKERLNAFLENDAFVDEGEIGSEDWDTLPG